MNGEIQNVNLKESMEQKVLFNSWDLSGNIYISKYRVLIAHEAILMSSLQDLL